MANALRTWIQSLITAVGVKSGKTGIINASELEDEIYALPDTSALQNVIKGLVENTATELVIPNGTEKIGDYAFYSSVITSVTIPNSVTTIGQSAFQYSHLSSVLIPSSVVSVGQNGFSSAWLNSVILEEGITTIFTYMFENSGLTEVTLPSSVTKIESFAFRSSTSLSKLNSNIEGEANFPDNIVSMEQNAFQKTKFTKIKFPASLAEIPYYCFSEVPIINLTIPNTITSIGERSFYNCRNLEEAIISDSVISIGKECFRGCSKLNKLKLGSSLTNLPYYAIAECPKLINLIVPSNITTFEAGCLLGGSSSEKATYIFQHTTPPTITTSTFSKSYLNRIYVPKGTSSNYKTATNWSNFADYIFEPNTITFNVDSSLLNNENVLYSIDNAEEQQFTQASFTGENLATLTVTSKTADIVVKVGTTNGGSEIGTVANATTTFTFESDTTIYITKQ